MTARPIEKSATREQVPSRAVLAFAATGWSIAFTNCPGVVAGLEAILHGWDLRRMAGCDADAEIVCGANGYRWSSAARSKPVLWSKRPPATAMNVIVDVHDVLFDWNLAEHRELLCLHAGAVEMGGGLVCFPSVRKAGKSTLCVALAAQGHRFYCDDVLPVDPQSLEGIAMGIAPRLRKPLPATLAPELRKFVEDRAGPGDGALTYVRLVGREAAPFGERQRIAALVLLERRESERAALAPLGKSDMLKEAILQNFGAQSAPSVVLDGLARLIERTDCYRLTYGDVGRAADMLDARLA